MIFPDDIEEKIARYLNVEFGNYGDSLIDAESLSYLGEIVIDNEKCHCWDYGDSTYCGTVSEYEGGYIIGLGKKNKN